MSLAAVFPGQGSQYVGMGQSLADALPACRVLLDEADAALGFTLSAVIANGPEDELTRTDVSQPAILVASWLSWTAWRDRQPDAVVTATAGLSLGEYTALLAAGALRFADAVRLVRLRGEAMQAAAEAQPSSMVALIGTDEAKATALCDAVRADGVLVVANLNAPGQVVISGDQAACDRAVAAAKDHGIRRAMPLPVAGAFHSPLMAPAAEQLGAALADTAITDPTIPVYTNVTAEPVTQADQVRDLLVQQLTSPVRWQASVERMAADGITETIELGPKKQLSGMIQKTTKAITCRNVDTLADLG